MDNPIGIPVGSGNPITGNTRNPAGSGNPITGSAAPMTSSPTNEPTDTEFPLVGSNYHPWARAMSMSLSYKNKLVFVNGTITKPSTDNMEKYLAWERCNNMVVSWIVRTLSPSIGSSVLWIDTAYGVWDYLKRRFIGPKSKLDARAKKCIFLGYANGTKGYKVTVIQQWGGPQIILTTVNNDHLEVPEISQVQSKDSGRSKKTPPRNDSFEQPGESHSPNQASSSDEACSSLDESPEQPPDVTHTTPSNISFQHATRRTKDLSRSSPT
nr:uncharacterized protein LOC109166622 [Ipomoea batatas]